MAPRPTRSLPAGASLAARARAVRAIAIAVSALHASDACYVPVASSVVFLASSADTAIAMARSARARAAKLVPVDTDLVGLGATAALVSDRPRKGEHRFHIAFANAAGIAHCTCVLAKGRRDRAAKEDLVSRAIVLWLARACGIAAPSPKEPLRCG